MLRKKDVLKEEIDHYVTKWKVSITVFYTTMHSYVVRKQETSDIDDFLPVFNRLAQWREMWLRPFVCVIIISGAIRC